MRYRTTALTAALAATAVTTAFAQAPAPPDVTRYEQVTSREYGTPPAPSSARPTNFNQEPTASLSVDNGPGADVGKHLVDEINADPSLKGSKITVQPEQGAITLSGVTGTRAQVKQIGKMAADKVGVEKVTNAIRDADPTPDTAQVGQAQANPQQADQQQTSQQAEPRQADSQQPSQQAEPRQADSQQPSQQAEPRQADPRQPESQSAK